MKRSVSVVIPAYEAASTIGRTVRAVREALDAEIVVVDDGSRDDTAAVARSAGADLVVRHDANRGKGAAVRSGMLPASGDIRLFADCDLACGPHQFARFADAIERGADVAIGNRRHRDAIRRGSPPLARRAASRTFALL